MDGSNPKISFIPKGSLVREESFMNRRRPRSLAGVLAGVVLFATVGAYTVFYYYNTNFEKEIASMTDKINALQQQFSEAPQVAKAQLFSSRANVARGLLDQHTVVSPVFTFLSENTVSSIVYGGFAFKKGSGGSTVDLMGEAPSYAALANQSDVFKLRRELLSYAISNVTLTQFGTVSFNLTLTFTPDYLLYSKTLSGTEASAPAAATATPAVDNTSAQTAGKEATTVVQPPSLNFGLPANQSLPPSLSGTIPTATDTAPVLDRNVSSTTEVTASSTATTTGVAPVAPEKMSFLQLILAKFKFW